jgi:WhiB family redox-sensing transcriptional regulator
VSGLCCGCDGGEACPEGGGVIFPGEVDGEWQDRARCLDLFPKTPDAIDVWFPSGSVVVRDQAVREAKRICGGCPVVGECLEWALSTGLEFGVAGGLTEVERRSLLRRRRTLRRAA